MRVVGRVHATRAIIDLNSDEYYPGRSRAAAQTVQRAGPQCMLAYQSRGVAMAEKTVLVCDRCGGDGAQRIRVVVGSRTLATDLCATHLTELTSAAHPVRRARRSSAGRKRSAGRPAAKASSGRGVSTRARKSSAAGRSNRNPDVSDDVKRLRSQGLSYRQVGDALMERGIRPRRAARWNPIVLSRMVKRSAA